MQSKKLKTTISLLPLWSTDGGQEVFTVKFNTCSITVSGQILSIEQARALFPALYERISDAGIDEPINTKGITRELKKFASYRITVVEDDGEWFFSPIEQMRMFGSAPNAVIKFNPHFFAIFGG